VKFIKAPGLTSGTAPRDGMPKRACLVVEDDPIIGARFRGHDICFRGYVRRDVPRRWSLIARSGHRNSRCSTREVCIREKSFAVCRTACRPLKIPFAFVTGYGADVGCPAGISRTSAAVPNPISTARCAAC